MRGALFAIAIVLACCGAAAARMPLPQRVAQAAAKEYTSGRTAGLEVAIVDAGRIAAAGTFGDTTPSTTFSVGSVSKMFTAVSVMQLAERGKLHLDDRAATYLPQFAASDTVTIRELLDHTSGIPNYLDDAVADGDVNTVTTPARILSSMLARGPDFSPGTDWNYSNTGYVALGQIVERVSGLPLAQYEQRFIFDPSGMRDTFVAPSFGKNVADSFGGTPGNWSWYYACGDVFSTAHDLAMFDVALMQGKFLSAQSFAQMQQTVPYTTFLPGMRDGLGLFLFQNGDLIEVGHHGGEPGYRADNEMIPARGFAVAVVGNGAYATQPIVNAALQQYFPDQHAGEAPPPSAWVDGAPAMTKRVSALLRDLAHGRADRSQFEVLASLAIEPMSEYLATAGDVQYVRFLNKAYMSSGILYEYQVGFPSGHATLGALVERDGKYAKLFLVR